MSLGPGRPRDPAIDGRILSATLGLLRELGYQQMSMEAVARAAGVAKPTLYRRYSSKATLVVAAIGATRRASPITPGNDSRVTLHELIRQTATALSDPGTMTIIGTLLAEEQREPELAATLRRELFVPSIEAVRQILQRGVERGEVGARADMDATIDMLFGALLARAALGRPADEGWLRALLETVWLGLAPRSSPPAESGPGPDSQFDRPPSRG